MKRAYITRAILKDYLTIKDVDITFNSDINVIIGNNGTGKTNFINYLNDILKYSSQFSNGEIHFNFGQDLMVKKVLISKFIDKDLSETDINDLVLIQNNIEIQEKRSILTLIVPVLINHGIPKRYDVADEPFSGSIIKIENGGYVNFINPRKNTLVNALGFFYIANIVFQKKPKQEFYENSLLKNLNENLSKFSNIDQVRIGQNLKISEVDEEEITFNNLYFEYFVNKEWLSFSQLSDGTKRLFYIISEITLTNRYIILLEEPELGLHPHQLYKLMDFIKQKSEDFQFIITTHSPVVLNILDKDQLDNIIISKIEDGSTTLEHLSFEQVEKAKAFMEEMDLSDYWLHSDLEE